MKEVMAVIRMPAINKVKKALTDAGVAAFFAHEVQGRGKGLVNPDLLKGAAEGSEEAAALLGEKGRLYPKRILSIVVEDDEVKNVVTTIMRSAKTGAPGDGKIFVLPVVDAARVRTGELGPEAIA